VFFVNITMAMAMMMSTAYDDTIEDPVDADTVGLTMVDSVEDAK
jgi:hypothetical protein